MRSNNSGFADCVFKYMYNSCGVERQRKTDMLCVVFFFWIQGDNQEESKRNSVIKPQIQEELRRLEDEITACKWTHTDTNTSCSKCTDPVLQVGVEHPKDPKLRSVCMCAIVFTQHCHHLFCFAIGIENTLLLCVFSAFPTTGFEQHMSLVFNPSNPESSVEDCLAAVGDCVARELDTNLAAAVDTLLTGSAFLFCECEKCGALQHTVMAVFATKKNKVTCGLSSIFMMYEKGICVHSFRATI